MPEGADEACLSATIASLAAGIQPSESSHGGKAVRAYGVKGALRMAQEGYRELFSDWLPYYRTVRTEPYALQQTLLRIMSGLDDTCIIHRAGFERARAVRAEAAALLQTFSEEKLKEMNRRYCAEGISPGGSADMLALTLLVDSIFPQL